MTTEVQTLVIGWTTAISTFLAAGGAFYYARLTFLTLKQLEKQNAKNFDPRLVARLYEGDIPESSEMIREFSSSEVEAELRKWESHIRATAIPEPIGRSNFLFLKLCNRGNSEIDKIHISFTINVRHHAGVTLDDKLQKDFDQELDCFIDDKSTAYLKLIPTDYFPNLDVKITNLKYFDADGHSFSIKNCADLTLTTSKPGLVLSKKEPSVSIADQLANTAEPSNIEIEEKHQEVNK